MAKLDASRDVSAETQTWLGGWLSGGKEMIDCPDEVKSELVGYRPHDACLLYRAETDAQSLSSSHTKLTRLSRWTHLLSVARDFAEGDDMRCIVKATLQPSDCLVDATLLPTSFMRLFVADEQEVIALPCQLNVALVE